MIGVQEIIGTALACFVIYLIFKFGGKKLKKEAPDVGRAMGETLKEFKNALTEVDDIKKEVKKRHTKDK